ncbi:MAG: DUF3791 domain-containing protein [Prevotellaceae bacterium]|nr:DUF3791 domain-containing protein [Prevotellaceae bacterium]
MKENEIRNNELEFATWCIGNVAKRLDIDDREAYQKLKQSDILYGYIVSAYDVLHTFGKEYLMEDILNLMKTRGVA